jgi:hypothetical protein
MFLAVCNTNLKCRTIKFLAYISSIPSLFNRTSTMATHQSSSQALSHPSLRWFRCIGFTQIALIALPRRNSTLLVASHSIAACANCQLARALTQLSAYHTKPLSFYMEFWRRMLG